jgi:hypothetical protein
MCLKNVPTFYPRLLAFDRKGEFVKWKMLRCHFDNMLYSEFRDVISKKCSRRLQRWRSRVGTALSLVGIYLIPAIWRYIQLLIQERKRDRI